MIPMQNQEEYEMTFLQKYVWHNIAKEGPGNTAEWKNGKIIAKKKRVYFWRREDRNGHT